MRYIVNLKSEQMNGITHWSGGVAPVRVLSVENNTSIAMSESILTPNKNNITGEIERMLGNENFITNEIIHGNNRVGSVEELMERLEQVQ
jgi:hypothetical protein